jgi:hypothetical protein
LSISEHPAGMASEEDINIELGIEHVTETNKEIQLINIRNTRAFR